MSYPVQAGQERLQMLAFTDSGAIKTGLTVADIQSLVMQRVGGADVTITVGSDDTDPDDAWSNGNMYERGNGEYLVSVEVTEGAKSVRLYGTWDDGTDNGVLDGTTHPLVNYDWQSRSAGVVAGSPTTLSLGVADMQWWVASDSAGENIVENGVTGEDGRTKTMQLVSGSTYYLWTRKLGYNDLVSHQFTAVAD